MSQFVRVQPYLPMLRQIQDTDDDSTGDMVGVGAAYHARLTCDGLDAESTVGNVATELALQRSQEELRQLSAQLLAIQELERKRIAADLHDGLGQSLSLIKLSMDTAIQLIKTGAHPEAVEALQQLGSKVKDAIAELHRTTMDMRPSMLDDLGILPTLSWFFRDFEAAWKDKTIERDIAIAESDVPLHVKVAIFRILQEAMNNIVKHADATRIRVCLKMADGSVRLTVEDNGQGFQPSDISARSVATRGFGLLTMRERARSSGGSFEMKSAPWCGTQICVSWLAAECGSGSGAESGVKSHW